MGIDIAAVLERAGVVDRAGVDQRIGVGEVLVVREVSRISQRRVVDERAAIGERGHGFIGGQRAAGAVVDRHDLEVGEARCVGERAGDELQRVDARAAVHRSGESGAGIQLQQVVARSELDSIVTRRAIDRAAVDDRVVECTGAVREADGVAARSDDGAAIDDLRRAARRGNTHTAGDQRSRVAVGDRTARAEIYAFAYDVLNRSKWVKKIATPTKASRP